MYACTGPAFAEYGCMEQDEKGATEDEVQRIQSIKGDEVLGYEGEGREEHSGENSPKAPKRIEDTLADNRPEQLGGK